MSQIDYGNVIQRPDGTFVVFVNLNSLHSGYHVCSKEVDPYNKYDLSDVQAYVAAHPEKVYTEHPMAHEVELQHQLEAEERKLEEINRQLFEDVIDKVFADESQPAVATMSLDAGSGADTASLLTQRAETKAAIASLEQQIEEARAARSA